MKFLIDTHILIWLAVSPERIPKSAFEIIENPQNDFYNAKCNVKVVVKKEKQLPKLTLKSKAIKLNKL